MWLLLDRGAEVNTQGGNHGNALQTASYRGRRAIVQLLLDQGADVDAQGGEHRSALWAALTPNERDLRHLSFRQPSGEVSSPVGCRCQTFHHAIRGAFRRVHLSAARHGLDDIRKGFEDIQTTQQQATQLAWKMGWKTMCVSSDICFFKRVLWIYAVDTRQM